MGQIILVLGAFLLLIFLTMSLNQAISNRVDDTYQAEAIIAATSLAQSMLNEVCTKAYDDSTLVYPVDSTNQFTPANVLGPETGEFYSTFDDVDDYNHYQRTDTIINGVFKTTVEVVYVSLADLEVASPNRSFYKKISVTVNSKQLKNIPLSLTRIVSY